MAVLSRLRLAAQPLLLRPLTRSFGSAAALDYDYYCHYYDDAEQEQEQKPINVNQAATEESDVWVPRRGVQWVIMGDPMLRRHVYAQKLSQLLDVPHISMASLVRQELHPHSSLCKQIASAVNEGNLVPEDVTFGLLAKRLEEGHNRGESGFILDGIPRTRVQAEILDQMADIDLVVNLQSSEESLWKRYLGNGHSSAPEEFFGIAKSRFNVGPESPDGRALKGKFSTYAEQNKPLEDYYRKQRKLLDFEVGGAPGDCFQGLLAALHLQHMHATGASQKLTV